jgi:serine/threonine protein phosphatase PrpC
VATLPQPILCDASVPKPKQPEEIIYQQTEKQQCFSYGCPLIPQDVYYNVAVRHALQQLREDASSLSSALDSCGTDLSATLTLIGYKGGDPRHQVNQDRALVLSPYHISQNKNGTLLGVFDGHARLGEGVSQHVVDRLPTILKEKLNRVDTTQQQQEEEEEQTRVALIETFQQLDKTAPADISGGCTASVILQLDTKVYIANAGDSVSFLAVYHSNTNITSVIYKSREDKPTLPDERKRVERMGGQVYAPEQGTSRVLYTDPMTGYQSGLAMSRSIGDWEGESCFQVF